MNRNYLLATFSLALLSLTSSANALVIAVTDSISAASPRTANGADVTITESSWGLDGGNAVVVLFSAENSDGITATYGGEPLTVVNTFDGSNHLSSIAYIIDPVATSADVVINANNFPGSRLSNAYAIFSLSNVGSFADSDGRENGGALNYTTTNNGYVFAALVNNSFNGTTIPSISGSPDTTIFSAAVDGNQSTFFAHGDVAAANSYSSSVSGIGNGDNGSATILALNAVPEPSTTLLGAIGSLLLFRRRRI